MPLLAEDECRNPITSVPMRRRVAFSDSEGGESDDSAMPLLAEDECRNPITSVPMRRRVAFSDSEGGESDDSDASVASGSEGDVESGLEERRECSRTMKKRKATSRNRNPIHSHTGEF